MARNGKYNAQRETVDGITFMSRREAREYRELKLLERAGHIENLTLQPKFPIQIGGMKVCTVIADFQYFDKQTGEMRVVDTKGFDTPMSKLKRKLVLAAHNIEIEVVR